MRPRDERGCGTTNRDPVKLFHSSKDDVKQIPGPNEAISPTQEDIRKQTPDMNTTDQTTGFDHVGIYRLALSPLLPVEFGWNA